eukprot:3265884-Prymnesium_polylepis.1
MPRQGAAASHQPSVTSHQPSVISRQSFWSHASPGGRRQPVLRHQSSAINHQSSVISHQSSIVLVTCLARGPPPACAERVDARG